MTLGKRVCYRTFAFIEPFSSNSLRVGPQMSNILLWVSPEEVPSPIADLLRENGFRLVWVRDGVATLRTLETQPVDGMVLFQPLSGLRGDEVCRVLWSRSDLVRLPVVWIAQETPAGPIPPEARLVRLPPSFSPQELLDALASVGLGGISAVAHELPPSSPGSPGAPTLPPDQVEEVVREVVERVVWEVVPTLAERLIREEIRRLLEEEHPSKSKKIAPP